MAVGKGGLYDTRLQVVRHTEPSYSERYPKLAAYWQQPDTPQRVVFQSNIFCSAAFLFRGGKEYLTLDDNIITSGYPSYWLRHFDDREFIPVAEEIICPKNWKKIEMDEIGL